MGGNHSASIMRPHRAVLKPGGRSGAWWAFILHKLQSLYLRSKGSCIQEGVVGRSPLTLGLTTSVLLFGLLDFSGQRCVCGLKIWICLAFTSPCRHLTPGQGGVGPRSSQPSPPAFSPSRSVFVTRDRRCPQDPLIGVVCFEK